MLASLFPRTTQPFVLAQRRIRPISTLCRSQDLAQFAGHLDALAEVRDIAKGISKWQGLSESSRAASLNAVPGSSAHQVQDAPPVSRDSLLAAERVVEIAAGSMPNSAFSACADALLVAVASATGDFAAGSRALKSLESCPALNSATRNNAKLAAARCDLLCAGQVANNLGESSFILDSPLNKAILDHDAGTLNNEIARLDNLMETSPDSCASAGVPLSLSRGLLAKACMDPSQDDAGVNRALAYLDGYIADCDAALGNAQAGSSATPLLAFITAFCEESARRDQLVALHALGLGLLAKNYHVAGKAVSSEGLYRSALKQLSSCSSGSIKGASALALTVIADDYASLLDDWENRSSDASRVREEHAGPKNPNIVLLDLKPWSVLSQD